MFEETHLKRELSQSIENTTFGFLSNSTSSSSQSRTITLLTTTIFTGRTEPRVKSSESVHFYMGLGGLKGTMKILRSENFVLVKYTEWLYSQKLPSCDVDFIHTRYGTGCEWCVWWNWSFRSLVGWGPEIHSQNRVFIPPEERWSRTYETRSLMLILLMMWETAR